MSMSILQVKRGTLMEVVTQVCINAVALLGLV